MNDKPVIFFTQKNVQKPFEFGPTTTGSFLSYNACWHLISLSFLKFHLSFGFVSLSAALCLFILFNFVCIALCLFACVNGAKTKKCLSVFKLALLGVEVFSCRSHFPLFRRWAFPGAKCLGDINIVCCRYTNIYELSLSIRFQQYIYALVCTWPDPYFIFCKLPFTHRYDLLLFHLLLTFFHLSPTLALSLLSTLLWLSMLFCYGSARLRQSSNQTICD